MARGQDRVEVKSMVDLLSVKKDMPHYVKDVRSVGVMGRGLADHNPLLFKVRLVGA